MTDPNNDAPAPQYPASNGAPDTNNPNETYPSAAPQSPASAPAYGQSAGNTQPAQPNPAYRQPYGQQSAPVYGQPAYGQSNGNPYGQPNGAYGQVPPSHNAYSAPAVANAVPLNKPYYGCSIQEAFLRFWKKYVVFKGRASRSEFWWWTLASLVIQVALSLIIDASDNHLSFLSTLWGLAIFIPGIALAIRRLHDINKSGWWLAGIYGSVFLGIILMFIGGGAAIFGGLGGWGTTSDNGYYAAAAAGSLGIILIGALIAAAAGIVYIVFMALPSKPEGARFDDDFAASAPYAPVSPAGAPDGYAPAAPGYGDPNAAPYGQAAPTAAPTYDPYAQQASRPAPNYAPYAQAAAQAAPTAPAAYGQPAPTAPNYGQPAATNAYTQPTAASPTPTPTPTNAPERNPGEDNGQKPWQGQ